MPFLLDLFPVGGVADRVGVGECDAGVLTFLLECNSDCPDLADQVRMAVEMNDVVEVAGSAAFGERTDLLGREIRDRVGERAVRGQRLVAVGVDNPASYRPVDECLVAGEVELDLGQRRRRGWTAESDPCLRRGVAAQVLAAPEGALSERDLESRLLVEPVADAAEDRDSCSGASGPPSMMVKSRSSEKR